MVGALPKFLRRRGIDARVVMPLYAGMRWHELELLDGALPVNPDGGLKSFGHPVGASGLRMMFEAWLQLRGEAPEDRRISTWPQRDLALTHNLGGYPGEMVSFISILGSALG